MISGINQDPGGLNVPKSSPGNLGTERYWRHLLTNQITGKSVLTNRRSVCQYCFHSRFIYLLGRTMGVWDPLTLGLLDCWTSGLGDLFTPPSSPHTSTYLLLSFPPTLVLFVMVCYGLIWFVMYGCSCLLRVTDGY